MQRSHHHFRRPQYHVNTCHRQVVSLSVQCSEANDVYSFGFNADGSDADGGGW